MHPLESLTAAASRLTQEAQFQHGPLAVRLRETAATIRCAVATIRALIEADGTARGKRVRQKLIMGDDGDG